MNSNQVKLVRDSFEVLRPKSAELAELFYARLFEVNPDLRVLFHGDMREQGSRLMDAIATLVEHLDRFSEVEPGLRDLAVRHAGYGIKIGDYEVVGEALLYALETSLAPDFTAETRKAWAATYLLLSTSMRSATP